MKRKLLALLCICTLSAALLSGCGGAGDSTAAPAADGGSYGTMEFAADTESAVQSPDLSAGKSAVQPSENETKLIYTASLSMETTDFDAASAGLERLTESCGGYIQQSDVENYGSGYRSGNYVVRVPAEKFEAFCRQAGELCHVTARSTNVADVSESYYDTAGRLKTQQTKLERLQTLLARADKMEDIITLENAISETEEQIDSLSGELSHTDALVADATVNLTLSEVYRLSNTEEPADSFSSRLGAALTSGWNGFVSAVQSALVALAYGWVWVAVLAAAAVIAVCVLRRRARRARAARQETPRPESGKAGDDKSGKEE